MSIGIMSRSTTGTSQSSIQTTRPAETPAVALTGVAQVARDRFEAAARSSSLSASEDDQLSSLIQIRANRGRAQEASVADGELETFGAAGPSDVGLATVDATPDAELDARQAKAVESALREWQAGVRESAGPNRSPRIDQYVRNAKMPLGLEWCGMFDAFNLSQAGFKEPWQLASYLKARDFFLYRDLVKADAPHNQKLDALREKQAGEGSQRQYFLLEGSDSPAVKHVRNHGSRYKHYDPAANTFAPQDLPIRPGDTVLFSRSHIGMVESYDQATGQLITIEGNGSGLGADGKQRHDAVVRNTYDLNDPAVRKLFDGFGRPALGDFR